MLRHSPRALALHVTIAATLIFPARFSAQSAECSNERAVTALIRAYVLSDLLFESRHFPPPKRIEDFVSENRSLFMAGGASVVCARALSSRLLGEAVKSYDPHAYENAINNGAGKFAYDVAASVNRPALELMETGFDLLWLSDVLPDLAEGDASRYYSTGTPKRLQGKQLLPTWDALLDDPTNGFMLAQLRGQLNATIAQAERNVRASVARML